MLISIILFLLNSLLVVHGKGKYDYGITIDAGSRHTGLFVFRWRKRITKSYLFPPKSQPECPDGWSVKIQPGVARYAYDMVPKSRDLENYLSPLFVFAKKTLNEHDIGKIPVYFGATAGVRMVTYERRHALMNRIRSYINSTGFMFTSKQALVLSGEEEAMYNWVNVNNLNKFKGGDGGSIGILDMGGASLEAAYETPYDILEGWIQVHVFDKDYRLYGRSYLQLGVREAFRRMILLTEETLMFTNPCVPSGCYFNWSDPDTGFKKRLVGSSHVGTCSHFVHSIIQATLPCHFPMDPAGRSECHAYAVYAPPQFPNMTFYGVDGFWDFTKELRLYKDLYQDMHHTSISLPVIKKYVDILCMNSWEDLKLRFKKTDEVFLGQACFQGTYIYEVLTTGLGFPKDFENFIFADTVNGKPLGWAPGLMIYKVNQMPVVVAGTVDEFQIAHEEPQWVKEDSVVTQFDYLSDSMGYKSIITFAAVVLFGILACLNYGAYVKDYLRKIVRSTSYVQLP